MVVKQSTGESSNSTVLVSVLEGVRPQVEIDALQFEKQNPNAKLVLSGRAFIDTDAADGVSSDITLSWETDAVSATTGLPLDLASPNVSSTGNERGNFVLLPNILTEGAEVSFRLIATYNGRSTYAQIPVVMNTAPYGGDIVLSGFTRRLKH